MCQRILLCLFFAVATASALAVDVGDRAPSWTLEQSTGRSVDYPSIAKDRVSVLFFFATWCPYCARMMPHLDQIRQDYAEDGVQIYALNFKDDGDPAAHIAERGYDFLVFPGADLVADDYRVMGAPGLFVVDGAGVVRYRRKPTNAPPGVEIAELWNEEIRNTLDALLYPDQ